MPNLTVNDTSLYYRMEGSGPPVLLIHGLGSCCLDWDPQVEALKADYTVIAPDVRGHGASDKPRGQYSVAGFADDMTALVRGLGFDCVQGIGVSMGGMILFQMAVDHPDVLRSMVIINSGPEVPNRTLQEKMAIAQRLILFRVLSMRKIGEVIGRRLFPEAEQAVMLDTFVERWAANDKAAYMAATRALAGWSVMDAIGRISTPTLVLASDMDYTPVDMKRAYVEQMPDARLEVIAEARHAVNFAQPEKVNPLILEFLQEHV